MKSVFYTQKSIYYQYYFLFDGYRKNCQETFDLDKYKIEP